VTVGAGKASPDRGIREIYSLFFRQLVAVCSRILFFVPFFFTFQISITIEMILTLHQVEILQSY
jgi:hypothetical protein